MKFRNPDAKEARPMGATSEAIAKIAGCSPATVSRVINGSARVSPQTRDAVMNAIRTAGTLPRRRNRGGHQAEIAHQALRSPRLSGLVEVVMHLTAPIEHVEVRGGVVTLGPIAPCPPDQFLRPEYRYSNSHFRRIIDGTIDELARWQMRPVLRTTGNLDDPQLQADLSDPELKGLILLGNEGADVEPFVRRCSCPVVSFVGMGGSASPPAVWTDNVPGMRQAVRHLRGLGHTHIGYVACPQNVSMFVDRFTAFKVAMMEVELPVRNEWVYDASMHVADIAVGAEKILAKAKRPSAIVCCYDGAAIGVMQAATRLGLAVPRDLSVVGFGNQDIADVLRPGLTTVNAPTYDMGRAAVKLLMMQRLKPDATEGLCVRLPTHLVERESTAPPLPDLSPGISPDGLVITSRNRGGT